MMRATTGALLAVALSSLAPSPLMPAAQAEPANGVCMAGQTKGEAPRAFTILVPNGQIAAMEARGFVTQPCAGKEGSAANFKTQICELASKAPASVQQTFKATYSTTPGELCAMASELSLAQSD